MMFHDLVSFISNFLAALLFGISLPLICVNQTVLTILLRICFPFKIESLPFGIFSITFRVEKLLLCRSVVT